MKGMEMHLALALIVAVILLLIIVFVVIIPGKSAGDQSSQQLSFREACLYWSTENYRGTSFVYNGKEINMNDATYCPSAIGHAMSTEDDWNRCRNQCKGL
jgi:hypothetical protein